MRGSIYPRGKWFWCAYYRNGKLTREACKDKHGANTADAKTSEKFLQARIDALTTEKGGGPAFVTRAASKLTVGELADALKADYELRSKNSVQNLSHIARMKADFGDYLAVAITPEKVDAYIERRLAANDRPASINRTTQLLSQAFGLAVRRGTLAKAPFVRHLSEAGNARQGFLGEKEVEAVIAHLPADLRDFTRFAFLTGWRKGEIASLTWADLDGATIRLRGEHSKNGESRVVPLAGELTKLMDRRKKARRMDSPFIFHRDGAAVAEFRKSWASATKKAGCAGALFHDLRRSAARRMLRANVAQAVAMKITGHKTASMFQRYAIVAESDLAQALEQTQAYKETARVAVMR